MEEIMKIAEEHGIYVIEDNAQAIGADYIFSDGTRKKTGTIGHIGCTSFFPSKNLGCYGDGGAIVTNDDTLADTMKKVANHGQSVRYYHDIVGCNSRLDTIQAAILNIKLPLLDSYIAARQKAASFYNNAFAGNSKIKTPVVANHSTHVYHQYTLILEGVDRNALNQYLAEQKIPSMIYYPVPAHRQKMFLGRSDGKEVLPVTDWLTERVISLPMHTELDNQQLEHISGHVLNFIGK
jgi:dTDP-4-amino-4,6-dideoxygalactose transaminase